MKQNLIGMLPIKKYLTLNEALYYTSCAPGKFMKIFGTKVSIHLVGKVKVYKVTDIDRVIEQNILIAC